MAKHAAPSAPVHRPIRKWTQQEITFLDAVLDLPVHLNNALIGELLGRTHDSVGGMRTQLNNGDVVVRTEVFNVKGAK